MARKIVGRFCERQLAPKSSFAKPSFRWKRSGRAWLLVGCPRGKWKPRAQRCAVGLRAYKLLKPTTNQQSGSCPAGQHRITKR